MSKLLSLQIYFGFYVEVQYNNQIEKNYKIKYQIEKIPITVHTPKLIYTSTPTNKTKTFSTCNSVAYCNYEIRRSGLISQLFKRV